MSYSRRLKSRRSIMKRIRDALPDKDARRLFLNDYMFSVYEYPALESTGESSLYYAPLNEALFHNLDVIESYGLPQPREMFLVATSFIAVSFLGGSFLRFIPAGNPSVDYMESLRSDVEIAHTLWDYWYDIPSPFPKIADFRGILDQVEENAIITRYNFEKLFKLFIEYELLQFNFAFHISYEQDKPEINQENNEPQCFLKIYLPLEPKFSIFVHSHEGKVAPVDYNDDKERRGLRNNRGNLEFELSNDEIDKDPLIAADRLVEFLSVCP